MWRIILACIAVMLFPAISEAAKKQRAKEPASFQGTDELLKWISGYRLRPEPQRLPSAVRFMSERSLLRETEQSGIYVGFTAGVLGSEPAIADDLVAKMFPLPPEDQVLIIKALAFSGLEDWKERLARLSERMPARRVLIDKYIYGDGKVLADLPLDSSPFAIDANWGYYFASGRMEPIARIITAVAWSNNGDHVEKLTIGNMAKWTLAQNATRDTDLMNYLKLELSEQPAEVRAPLREVVDAAETFELGKIRKDAMASIEELKVKGPETTRKIAWWGQAGQTVFALGCIAAGALGHVEVGIPCVVGGALSTAALKYLVPSQ